MKNLKELGLNPIDEKQAENINGGYTGFPPVFIHPVDIMICIVNIPPMEPNGEIWGGFR